MSQDFNPERERFGSASFADARDIERAGLFEQTPESVFLGFHDQRALYHNGMAGQVIVGGARSGKLRDLLAYSVCPGVHFGTALIVDPKGELAAISRNQVIAKKHCVYWNPAGLHGLPQDRINPTGHIVKGSPTLVSDIRAFAHRMIGRSGGTNAVYFEETAERYLLPICLTLVMIHGVLRLPDLYDVLTALPGGGEAWLDFAFEMSESGIHEAIEVEKEIAKARGSDTGGFRGVAGELLKTFAALSDPLLRASVSPPYTFDLAELTASDDRFHLYLMPPAEFIGPWSPVIKAILSTAQTLKSRAPGAPRQTWMIDECAQLKNFGLIPELYSIGAGQGIRPVAVFQSTFQMNALGPDAENIITSSAAVRQYFSIRDLPSAQTVSRMLGSQTLEYNDELQQARAEYAKREALSVLVDGGDPLKAGAKLGHHAEAARHRTRQQRWLRDPAEMLALPPDRQIIFADGLPAPIYAARKPFYDQAFMAGRYFPNPMYSSEPFVRVKTRFGVKRRRVITGPVSPEHGHYRQYAGGQWSYIEGYKP